ncbi:lipoprotein insertase outer membrane protein LolB [Vibrio sp. S4M6]|uniref:lipoprotein insertase outer membrane protein LolB n=1 Tax=Vibrio sinus TaxID=2946865 RepID=UPI00202AAF5B|nr:lipoprotein insertase outer membrane protein LolB [Vibrio sinus]MCL9781914.1 lipoprotein insertase outer membrane protein LolB [Vibrio sinus]
MKQLKKILFFLITLTVISGCSSLPKSSTNVQWQQQQARLTSIKSYQAIGKLNYISPKQRESLYFQWKHSDSKSQLRLTTFLGQSVLNLVITPKESSVTTYNNTVYKDTNPSRLVYKLTGLELPIKQLQDWLLGKPTGADNYQLNPTNTVASLDKVVDGAHWTLLYQAYTDETVDGNTVPLPSKFSLKQGDTRLNITVSKWKLNP